METGDGLLVRLRPFGGRLTASQAVLLDGLASTCGNGIVEITSRGALQVRGLRAETHAGFVVGACAAGLGDADPVRERRRRVMAAPFADEGLLAEVEEALVSCEDADRLPAKFIVRVDGGVVSVGDVPADLVVGADGSVTPGGRDGRGSGRGPIGVFGDWAAVAPRFGAFGPGELAALAGRAEGVLRVTPFRSVILSGDVTGLPVITRADDPRLRIVACVGAPRCASGVRPARDVAEQYVGSVPLDGMLYLGGCSKGCGSGAAGPSGSRAEPW